ncbi:MAG: alpha/beta hydrolase [Yoonia sp.]|uniref:alpha/beta hydrolase n=1 Tax=Yoonia sp. TaxID=2212373 RepID=UPI003EFB0B9A
MFTLLVLHGSSRDETDLAEYSTRIAPQARVIAPRGAFREGDGFTFFKRRADRSIATAEVVALARQWLLNELDLLLPASEKLIIAGYSSGAVYAQALLSVMPDRFAGAILMRPEPLSADFAFPDLAGKPILIFAGKHDERRRPTDAPLLAAQLKAVGAEVTLHILDSGHGWAPHGEDIVLARTWLTGT